MWKPIKDSANYLSECGNFIAIFRHAYSGHALYWVFPIMEKKRIQKNAVAVGGLPTKHVMDRIKSGTIGV